jgi:transposase
MMGAPQEAKPRLFHYGLNLESRVRPNNPLRRIRELIDFGFTREAVKDKYGKKGHESEDPIVIMKMMLLLFMDNVASERELMRVVGERLDYMWFLGFDLDDEIPNHSVLSKARRRWGQAVFEELFVQSVKQCIEKGLIDGNKVHMDGTLINGNASKESVRRGPVELIEQLRQVYKTEEQKLDDATKKARPGAARGKSDVAPAVVGSDEDDGQSDLPLSNPSPSLEAVSLSPMPSMPAEQRAEVEEKREVESKDAKAPAAEVSGEKPSEPNQVELSICSRNQIAMPRPAAAPEAMVSKTDADTAVVRKGRADGARPRYKAHRAVDNQCGVITATTTTAGDVGENAMLMALVDQHEQHTGRRVDTIVGDAQYGTNDNFASCEERGIRSHMADLRSTYRNDQSSAVFGEDQFRYDAEKDLYQCPAGESLTRKGEARSYHVYGISGKICSACPLRQRCTRSKSGRTLKRHRQHDLVEKARARSHSGAARRDRKRRRHLMEGSFADGANNHGLKRARWRGLSNQLVQDYLIAACQNIRIAIRFGYRPAPAVSMAATAPRPAEIRQSSELSALRPVYGRLHRLRTRHWRRLGRLRSLF